MTRSSGNIRVFDWSVQDRPDDQGCHALFNCEAIAMANRLEGHAPFAIEVNQVPYLGYKRHQSAVVAGLSVEELVTLLENIQKVRSILGPMGIKTLSLNTLNAVNKKEALKSAIGLNCKIRFEFLLDVAEYSSTRISSNHKRNIKKSNKAGARIMLPVDIEAMRCHIDVVNLNLADKGLGGITNSPEYFRYLVEHNAGLLMQVTENDQLLASTFFVTNQEYAYYHSSGTTDRGKQIGAAYFLVDCMIAEMQKRGMCYLNLGGCTSGQTGLQRFKMGFRPQTRILASAHRRLIRSPKQRIRSLLATRPEDILSIDRVKVYKKSVAGLPPVSCEDYTLRKMSYDSLFEVVSTAPEFSRCLEIFCCRSPHCYALCDKQEKVLALGFFTLADTGSKPVSDGEALTPDLAVITYLQVVNNMQAKGLGRSFLGLLGRELSQLGFTQVCGRAAAQDIAAQKMMLAAGFALVGDARTVSTAIMGRRSRTFGRIKG